MKISLTEAQKIALEVQHKSERDKRVADRIKGVLLSSEGWTQRQIAQALKIHEATEASKMVLPNIKAQLRSRINDNFHIINPGSSI